MGAHIHKLILVLVTCGFFGLAVSTPVMAQSDEEPDPDLITLAETFYAWQAANQPSGPYAIVRVTRPDNWEPDWSRTALQTRKTEFQQFQIQLKSVNNRLGGTADRIDATLLGSAMARMYWELDVLASPRRDPGFALNQSLGSIFELLVQHPEPNEAQLLELISRLEQFPAIINAAKLGLDETVAVLADAAISKIGDVDSKIDDLEQALVSFVPVDLESEFTLGFRAARQSLASYKDWLSISHARFDAPVSIGEQRLRWYLGHVALVPRSTDSIVVESELALAQIGAQLALDRQRFAQTPEATPFEGLDRLLLMLDISRTELETYMGTVGLLSNSEENAGMHYTVLPPSLEPIANMGELMTYSPTDKTGSRYLPNREESVGFLESAMWIEPRLLLAWEDKPGFAAQWAQASGNARQVRRRATGVALRNGISLYFHEQFLKAGLYSFKPVSHQLAVELLAYRAALAQADIRIARGEWDIREAVEFLQTNTERDKTEAESDVLDLIASPGIAAASFAVFGQIVRYLADESRISGEQFSLEAFNDRLLLNAHVPVSLQRWAYLGLEDELDELVDQRGRPATVPE